MGLLFSLAIGVPVVAFLVSLPFVMRGRVTTYSPKRSSQGDRQSATG